MFTQPHIDPFRFISDSKCNAKQPILKHPKNCAGKISRCQVVLQAQLHMNQSGLQRKPTDVSWFSPRMSPAPLGPPASTSVQPSQENEYAHAQAHNPAGYFKAIQQHSSDLVDMFVSLPRSQHQNNSYLSTQREDSVNRSSDQLTQRSRSGLPLSTLSSLYGVHLEYQAGFRNPKGGTAQISRDVSSPKQHSQHQGHLTNHEPQNQSHHLTQHTSKHLSQRSALTVISGISNSPSETSRWLQQYTISESLLPIISLLKNGAEQDPYVLSDAGLLYHYIDNPENDMEVPRLVPPEGAIRDELIQAALERSDMVVNIAFIDLESKYRWEGMQEELLAKHMSA